MQISNANIQCKYPEYSNIRTFEYYLYLFTSTTWQTMPDGVISCPNRFSQWGEQPYTVKSVLSLCKLSLTFSIFFSLSALSDANIQCKYPMQISNANIQCKYPMQISKANIQCKYPMQISNANIQYKYPMQISNANIQCKYPMQISNAKIQCKYPMQISNANI